MARYSDGQTALSYQIAIAAAADGVLIATPHGNAHWGWGDIERVDDGGGVILKCKPDTGERLALEEAERAALEAHAPELFSAKGVRRESARLTLGLVATAASLAALFFLGVPLAAQPLSHLIPQRYASHLGEIAWGQVNAMSAECPAYDEAGWEPLDAMFAKLRSFAKNAGASELYVVDASFPNAFTLPDNSIVLTDEMIGLAENPDEIAGVIAHELGHVEAGHVMQNVIRQLGLGMFVDIVFGGAGAGQTIAAINVLSLRYTRGDEEEADRIALRIMDESGLDPGAVARLFRRLAQYEHDAHATLPEFLSSHPDSARRAENAARFARPGRAQALTAADWNAVQALCGSDGSKGDPKVPHVIAPMEKAPWQTPPTKE
ncbi:MAG: M48 family metallopeptidase [Caulobacterales bacterium]